jgi:hypothetical protein
MWPHIVRGIPAETIPGDSPQDPIRRYVEDQVVLGIGDNEIPGSIGGEAKNSTETRRKGRPPISTKRRGAACNSRDDLRRCDSRETGNREQPTHERLFFESTTTARSQAGKGETERLRIRCFNYLPLGKPCGRQLPYG